MEYCKKCKFIKRNWIHAILSLGLSNDQWRFAKCSHIKSFIDDENFIIPIKPKAHTPRYCSTMRKFNTLCGRDAKFYKIGHQKFNWWFDV